MSTLPSQTQTLHQALISPIIRTLQIGNVWFEERQGGLARVFFELFRHLPACGVGFKGLVIGSGALEQKYGGQIEEFAAASEPLACRLFKARFALHRVLAGQSIDLIASHFALYTFPALPKICRLPLVVHFHGPWAAEGGVEGTRWLRMKVQRILEQSVYQRARRFIVLSQAFGRELVEHYRVPESSVRVVPAGVDICRFHADISRRAARERLGWPLDRFIMLAVRRLAHRMGLEDLIYATKSLVAKTPDLLVHIAGTGSRAQDLEKLIEELGLRRNVRLLGRIDDAMLPVVYRAADLSIVPSVALEGFGMITLESLASGTPVIVTPVGGLPEVVRSLSSHLIFENSGADAVSRGLSEILRGERRLPNDSECRSYAASKFTWPVIASQIRQVYLEALH